MQAFLVSMLLALLWFIEKVGGTPMVIRPIVVSPLVGLIMNDLNTGLVIGASLELVFMGAIQIGGAVPPDVLVGSGLGSVFAMMNHSSPEIAIALALPIAIVAQSLKVIVFILRSWMMNLAVKFARSANFKGLYILNLLGLLLQCFMYFVVCYMSISLGADAVNNLIASIPEFVMKGLNVSASLLPAVGFALLLQPMLTKYNFIYFLIGFVLIAYLKLPILAVTILACGIAYMVCFENKEKQTIQNVKNKEDLFDV